MAVTPHIVGDLVADSGVGNLTTFRPLIQLLHLSLLVMDLFSRLPQ
jgi:hypothetical protein